MELVKYPSKILREHAGEVEFFGDKRELMMNMVRLMVQNNGLGLAAPQVGLSLKTFVWIHDGYPHAIWNPEIKCLSGELTLPEGCLSLPGISVSKTRSCSSVLIGNGINGKPLQFNGNALMTRIWQHEIDHLNGTLIIDSMSKTDEVKNTKAIRLLMEQ